MIGQSEETARQRREHDKTRLIEFLTREPRPRLCITAAVALKPSYVSELLAEMVAAGEVEIRPQSRKATLYAAARTKKAPTFARVW